MVGRPCGQFQGDSRPARLSTTRRIVDLSSDLPIMMEDRQARIASIARTLQEIRQHYFFPHKECISSEQMSVALYARQHILHPGGMIDS